MYSLTGARFRVPIGHNYCVRPDHSLYPSLDSNRRDSRLVDPNIPSTTCNFRGISQFSRLDVLFGEPPPPPAQLRSCLEDWVSRSVTCPKRRRKRKEKTWSLQHCALLSVCSYAGSFVGRNPPPLTVAHCSDRD